MNQHSQASKKSHGCLILPLLAHLSCPVGPREDHTESCEDGETQLSGEDRERSMPQPQLKLHLGPLAEFVLPLDRELLPTP